MRSCRDVQNGEVSKRTCRVKSMTKPLVAEDTDARKLWIYVLIWLGEAVSIIGSDLTGFALSVWIYQQSGSITQFSLIILCAEIPGIVLLPLVGAIVDRSDRRKIMILSNVGAGVFTIIIALLHSAGWLHLWHICILSALISTCSAFSKPAYGASVPLLVPKRHLGRASGMMQTAQAASQILAPMLAGFLVLTIQLKGVLLIDFLTYVFAVGTLLAVHIPRPPVTTEGEAGKGSLLREAAYGWTYVIHRPGILGLLMFFAITNFTVTMSNVLITPLLLSFTNAAVFGTVLSVTGAGMLTGGLLVSFWGGPKCRIYGVYLYGIVQGLALILQGVRPNAVLIGFALFCAAFSSPIVNASIVPILQSKTSPDVLGRVFAAMRLVAWCSVPISFLVAGPLADNIFEPLMVEGGALAGSVGSVIGVGTGRGIALILIVMGIITLIATLKAYLSPRILYVEAELPDMLPDNIAAESR